MTSLNERQIIKVGSRKSELALVQTKYVIACLQVLFPELKFEIHSMTTMGDRVLNKSLPKIGEKSLFTKDLEEALTHGGVDFVVHSLKDLPTQLPMGMAIGAVLQREDPRDALVLNNKFIGFKLKTLPEGSVIGTSSLRRAAQLSRNYKHLKVIDIRGNLNTRLAKLDAPQSKFSGIILANAGLNRMGWSNRVSQVLEPEELLYAVGQGALAVECRVNDPFILNILHKLCDLETQCRIITERSFLKTLGGGCSAPVAVCTNLSKNLQLDNNDYTLDVDGAVWSLNGDTEIVDKISFNLTLDSPAQNISEDKNDDKNIDISTTKRLKLGHEGVENMKKEPVIINDNALPCSSSMIEKETLNITEIMNIHGKVFDQCPFTGKLNKKDNNNGTKPVELQDAIGVCPVSGADSKLKFNLQKMLIGQDFMGDCPVLNTNQKVSYDFASVGAGDEAFSCPLISKFSSHQNVTTEQISKCPFFQKKLNDNQLTGVELIDYEENNKGKCKRKSLVEDCMTNEDSVYLYCGLFSHKKQSNILFQMCEKMGFNLANKLISAGALAVMKIAQNEIHCKA